MAKVTIDVVLIAYYEDLERQVSIHLLEIDGSWYVEVIRGEVKSDNLVLQSKEDARITFNALVHTEVSDGGL